MLENLFRGLFDSDLVSVISVSDFLLCLGFSLVLGLVMAFAYMYHTRYTKSLLPWLYCRRWYALLLCWSTVTWEPVWRWQVHSALCA